MGRKVPVYGRYGETTAAGDVCLTSEFVIKINFGASTLEERVD
jgi:hypothetical protein